MKSLELTAPSLPLDTSLLDKTPARLRFREVFARGILVLAALAMGCLGAGLIINQSRDWPLPLVYASKQRRIVQAAALLAGDSAPAPVLIEKALATRIIKTSGIPRTLGLLKFHTFPSRKRGVALYIRHGEGVGRGLRKGESEGKGRMWRKFHAGIDFALANRCSNEYIGVRGI